MSFQKIISNKWNLLDTTHIAAPQSFYLSLLIYPNLSPLVNIVDCGGFTGCWFGGIQCAFCKIFFHFLINFIKLDQTSFFLHLFPWFHRWGTGACPQCGVLRSDLLASRYREVELCQQKLGFLANSEDKQSLSHSFYVTVNICRMSYVWPPYVYCSEAPRSCD